MGYICPQMVPINKYIKTETKPWNIQLQWKYSCIISIFLLQKGIKNWYVYKTISLKTVKKQKEKRGEAWLLCRLLWSWGQMNRREGRTHPLAMKQFIHYNHFSAACQIISASRHNAHSASPPEKSRPLPHSLFTWATSPPYSETLRSTNVWAHSRALHSVCLRPSRGPRRISFGGEKKKKYSWK